MIVVDQDQAHASSISLTSFVILLLFDVTLRSQLRCDLYQCDQANMWDVRVIVTRDKTFLSLIVWSLKREIRISQAKSS